MVRKRHIASDRRPPDSREMRLRERMLTETKSFLDQHLGNQKPDWETRIGTPHGFLGNWRGCVERR